jgi:hypothetical protein
MLVSISPNESQINAALRSYLLSILPVGVEVVLGEQNRVPEPAGSDFVVFTPLFRNRLSTNWDVYQDVTYTGSISGTTLTITAAPSTASLQVGSPVFGTSITLGTTISALGTGTGGVGTYQVTPSQTVGSALIASGATQFTQPTQITAQLDVHGPNSADNAQVITTLFRDGFTFDALGGTAGVICPLHADDPKEVPFMNAEQQYEVRWIVTALFQSNQVVTVTGQQFATQVTIPLHPVPEIVP